jgi:hypothetical protein
MVVILRIGKLLQVVPFKIRHIQTDNGSEFARYFDDKYLYAGLTYNGHALACASALATIAVYEEDHLIENAARLGEHLKVVLEGIKSRHPQWEMYSGSKHGVRYLLKQNKTLPPTAAAPTCQTCHMQEGNHEVRTAWGFLAVRLPMPEDKEWAADRGPPEERVLRCHLPHQPPVRRNRRTPVLPVRRRRPGRDRPCRRCRARRGHHGCPSSSARPGC